MKLYQEQRVGPRPIALGLISFSSLYILKDSEGGADPDVWCCP